ncbi:chemotaxis protein methyltransferase CheR [Phyllobacterium bourgognense]|uniref:histidine kinase n=2 Tax=Phyllobacterium bourgognense TaxID=314236 RepID=A0A368YEG4_9HYPH|nr:chemotaxis protein methyltransferase CheR [Phyllobacterium bourgognense]
MCSIWRSTAKLFRSTLRAFQPWRRLLVHGAVVSAELPRQFLKVNLPRVIASTSVTKCPKRIIQTICAVNNPLATLVGEQSIIARGSNGRSYRSRTGFGSDPPFVMIDLPNLEDAQKLAQAIVNTIPEPFLVLDDKIRVLAASRSFYEKFKVDPEQTRARLLYSLGDGQWNIPALRILLETIIPEKTAMDGFEVEHDFPNLGHRTMLLNARKVLYDDSSLSTILLAFSDVTDRRMIEREKANLLQQTEELLRQKDTLLQEMQHRVANSLQIIASILLLKARAITSEETRLHLQDAHQRVMSVAEVQRHLHTSISVDQIEVGSYLSKLCASLAASMTGENNPVAINVLADKEWIGSDKAVSVGLIVTELVINAIKYAFPLLKAEDAIFVTYEVDKTDWKLIVSDNGIGKNTVTTSETAGGLGTAIVQALVRQLDAKMDVASSAKGTSVSITRATFTSRLPKAA